MTKLIFYAYSPLMVGGLTLHIETLMWCFCAPNWYRELTLQWINQRVIDTWNRSRRSFVLPACQARDRKRKQERKRERQRPREFNGAQKRANKRISKPFNILRNSLPADFDSDVLSLYSSLDSWLIFKLSSLFEIWYACELS